MCHCSGIDTHKVEAEIAPRGDVTSAQEPCDDRLITNNMTTLS